MAPHPGQANGVLVVGRLLSAGRPAIEQVVHVGPIDDVGDPLGLAVIELAGGAAGDMTGGLSGSRSQLMPSKLDAR